MTTPFEVLFTVTVYRDGQVRVGGNGRTNRLAEVLRIIADAIDDGALVLNEEGEPYGEQFPTRPGDWRNY